jgi:two-component system KDP operon response regulator KdpE
MNSDLTTGSSLIPNKRILIVEDDADVRLGYQVLLKAHNYETFFAANAVAALTESRTHDPDLIILDLGLPGIDGFDLLEHLGPMYVFLVPVIVVSGRELHRNKERALNAGAVEYLQKPWNDDELLEMIARYASDPSSSQMPPTGGAMEIALPNAA